MSQFDATHAWDLGYYAAVRGILRMPCGTWLAAFAEDWRTGYEAAKRAGKWYCPHLRWLSDCHDIPGAI